MIDNDISVHMACYHLITAARAPPQRWVKITYLI